MEEFLDWINMFYINILGLGVALMAILAPLAIILLVLEAIFGEPESTTKNNKKSVAKRTGVACDWDTADEAQRRFLEDSIRAHEESVRLHDMAAIEAWDAQTTACDQHEAATDMFNDFGCGGCDPWF